MGYNKDAFDTEDYLTSTASPSEYVYGTDEIFAGSAKGRAKSNADALASFAKSRPASDSRLALERERSGAITVTSALNLAKGALEDVRVTILGEVSEVNIKRGYKAVYFTVKDENSSLPCMIWNSRYAGLGIDLSVGALVILTGRFSLYAKKGRMSFDVFNIKLAGEGALRMRVAQLAKKLEAQGLMDSSRKRPAPEYPETVGLVTSPRGDAVHDVLRTLRRRYPLARVLLAGVPVEGAGAATGMAQALQALESAGAEVILLVRGGGSFEDLMPFNDETLARTIAACSVPVITGIGHEPDNSIADMVADKRASTPTAAAEAVSPGCDALRERIFKQANHMHSHFSNNLQKCLPPVNARANRIIMHATSNMQKQTFELDRFASNSVLRDPHSLLADWNLEIDMLTQKIAQLLKTSTSLANAQLSQAAATLDSLSPLSVLSRGYSITRDERGQIIKDASSVRAGEMLNIKLGTGDIDAQVIKVNTRR